MPSTTCRSRSGPARSTRSSARTARASRPSARSSPASSRRTRATSSCGGRPSRSRSPRQALVRGIALVAQEVALVPRLTVAENVFLGAEPRRAGFIDRRSLRRSIRAPDARSPASTSTRPRWSATCRSPSSSRSRSCARSRATPISSSSTSPRRACRRRRSTACTRSCADCARRAARSSSSRTSSTRSSTSSDVVTVLRDGRVIRTNPTADETENSLVTGDARPARRPRLPRQAAAASGRTRRPVHPMACPRPASRARR